MTPSRSSITNFMVSGEQRVVGRPGLSGRFYPFTTHYSLFNSLLSGCQLGNIGDPVEKVIQLGQQRQPVLAYLRVFRVDQHLVEEAVHLRPHASERAETVHELPA